MSAVDITGFELARRRQRLHEQEVTAPVVEEMPVVAEVEPDKVVDAPRRRGRPAKKWQSQSK